MLLADAKNPLLLAGAQLRSFGAIDAFRELAEALGCAVAVMPNAKGFFRRGSSPIHRRLLGRCEQSWLRGDCRLGGLVLAAGPVFTDYTTAGWTALPAPIA